MSAAMSANRRCRCGHIHGKHDAETAACRIAGCVCVRYVANYVRTQRAPERVPVYLTRAELLAARDVLRLPRNADIQSVPSDALRSLRDMVNAALGGATA